MSRGTRRGLLSQSRVLEELVKGFPRQQSRVRRITRDTVSYVNDYSVPLIDTARRDPVSARTVAATEEGRLRMDAIRAEFDTLVATERTFALRLRERSQAVARRAFIAAATGLVGSVLLILAFVGYLARAIVRPVLATAAMAKRLAGGDLSVRVPETGVGEMRVLERAFNTMAGSLEGTRAQLAASRARIVTSADETRRRIERDLHDGIQQRAIWTGSVGVFWSSLARGTLTVPAGTVSLQSAYDTGLGIAVVVGWGCLLLMWRIAWSRDDGRLDTSVGTEPPPAC